MKMRLLFPIFAVALLAACAAAPDRAADDTFDIARFQAVNVAPIQFAPDALSNLPDDERVALERDLRAALRAGLPQSRLTDDLSGGVVRIEVTVTELNPVNPAVNLFTTALLFVPFDAGGVAFEARFYDGDSREPFAQTTYRHGSTPMELKGSFSRYGHAAKALHDWAEEISSGLVDAASRRTATRG